MAVKAGTAYVSVEYDPKSITKLRAVTAAQGRHVGSSLGDAGRRAGHLMAVGIGVGAVAVGYGMGKAIQSAADFQKQLNILQAVSGATSKQMKAISAESIALGKDLKLPATSASDAAVAMTELAKGGLSVTDSMHAARGALELAAAGQVDAATAASVMASSLNQFNLAGTEAAHVADLLAGAANASAGDVTDFAEGLKYAGTSAHAAGQSIDITVAALAEMANKGLAGSVAGSSLAQALRALQAPSAKAADEIKKFGLNIYDASGKMKPLDQIANIFTKQLGDLTQKQQNATLATIFGSRAVQAARVVFLGGGKELDKYKDKVGKTGNAQRLAAAQMKGFSGALQGFTSNIETLGIQLGLFLLPAATKVVGALNDVLTVIGQIAAAPSLKVAFQIAWRGAGKIYDSLKEALFGETRTLSQQARGHRDLGMPITIDKKGLVPQIVDAVTAGFAAVPWNEIGKKVAAAFAAGLQFTTQQASKLVSSLTEGIVANKDQIAEAVTGIMLSIGSAFVDPTVWKDNWKSILALGIVALTAGFGDFAAVGGRIGVAITRPIGRVLERVLPNVAKDAIFAVETLFRTGFGRIGARILATLRGDATRFPTFFNRAFVAIERAGGRIISDLGSRIVAVFRSVFGKSEHEGEQAMAGVGRAIVRAAGKAGAFLVKFTIVRGAIDGITRAFQYVIDKIKEAIGWVSNLAGKIAAIHLPGAGIVNTVVDAVNPFHRAAGGPVAAGSPYIVGEKGPELFVPNNTGTIISNDKTAAAVRKVMDRMWRFVGHRLFPGYGQPPARFYKSLPGAYGADAAAGLAWNGPHRHIKLVKGQLSWLTEPHLDRKYWRSRAAAVELILHEWAHAFQNNKTWSSVRNREGGAEAFGLGVLPATLRALGFGAARIPASQSIYPGYLRSVERYGPMWSVFDQFVHKRYHTLATRRRQAREFGMQGFAGGGVVFGGVAGRDSVPAMLTPGEVVLNEAQQRALLHGGGAPVEVNVMISRREIAGIAEVEVIRGNRRTTRRVQAGRVYA